MIQVSKNFKESIYASSRKTSAKVTFEMLDNEAYSDNSVVASEGAQISRLDQLTNKKRNMSQKYATFEKDYFKLDGSFHIPPKNTEGNFELGWWGDEISAEDGSFSQEQIIEFNFLEPHNSIGLSISFDTLANEYAADFDIEVLDNLGARIHLATVLGNTSPLYVLEHGFENYRNIILTIRKWGNGFRRARVTEVDFGVIKEYTGTQLINLNIIEEMDLVGDTIPSNELKFTIDNSDKSFNILNPNGFHRYLKERQEVTVEIGLEVNEFEEEFEYIPMGKYYLIDWQSDEGALTTTFIARNIFEILEQIEYTNLLQNVSLYDLAVDVLESAGIDSYDIDPNFKQIMTAGFKEKLSSRVALQYICIAGTGVIVQNRYGAIPIRQFEPLTESTGYMSFTGMDAFAGVTVPEVDQDYDFKYINFDNVYTEPQIKLDTLVQSISILIHDGSESPQETIFKDASIKTGQSLKVDNPLINNASHAEQVANWLFREFNLRALYTIDWRQNPALECGDAVLVEDSFGMKKKSRIIKQEFYFEGYLGGNTETKGGV